MSSYENEIARESLRMSDVRRACKFAAGLSRVGRISGGLGVKFTGGPSRLGNGGNSVFEDQLFLRSGFEQDRELVEASDPARKFSSVYQVNNNGSLFPADRIEKCVLDVLWCLFAVGHDLKPGSLDFAWLQSDYNSDHGLTRERRRCDRNFII
jgi:hypothetical protein